MFSSPATPSTSPRSGTPSDGSAQADASRHSLQVRFPLSASATVRFPTVHGPAPSRCSRDRRAHRSFPSALTPATVGSFRRWARCIQRCGPAFSRENCSASAVLESASASVPASTRPRCRALPTIPPRPHTCEPERTCSRNDLRRDRRADRARTASVRSRCARTGKHARPIRLAPCHHFAST